MGFSFIVTGNYPRKPPTVCVSGKRMIEVDANLGPFGAFFRF